MQVADELFMRAGCVPSASTIIKAGAAKATLYAHFPTKDGLIAACRSKRRRRNHRHVARICRSSAKYRCNLPCARRRVVRTISRMSFINAAAGIGPSPARLVVAAQRQWIWELFRDAVRQARLASRRHWRISWCCCMTQHSLDHRTGTAKPATRAREAARFSGREWHEVALTDCHRPATSTRGLLTIFKYQVSMAESYSYHIDGR